MFFSGSYAGINFHQWGVGYICLIVFILVIHSFNRSLIISFIPSDSHSVVRPFFQSVICSFILIHSVSHSIHLHFECICISKCQSFDILDIFSTTDLQQRFCQSLIRPGYSLLYVTLPHSLWYVSGLWHLYFFPKRYSEVWVWFTDSLAIPLVFSKFI